MARSSWSLVSCLALGGAALVLAFVPSVWPNPLGDGVIDATRALERLQPAAAAVDAACRRGDDRAFAAVTTAAYRRDLDQQLHAVDGTLDVDMLRALARGAPCRDWLTLPPLAGHVHGDRAAVAVRRDGDDGAQILSFVWNGQRFLFDGSRHARAIDSVAEAELAVRAAVGAAAGAAEPRSGASR